MTGMVLIPVFESPSKSFKSLICDHKKVISVTENTICIGNVEKSLEFENVKKPAMNMATQLRLIIRDDNTGTFFKRVGGIEYV